MRLSLGYDSMDINSVEELSKIEKPDYSIEILRGDMGKGKTYLLDNYFYENLTKNCIYYKELPCFKDRNVDYGLSSYDFYSAKIDKYLEEYGKAIIYNKNKDVLEKLIDYCLEANVELLIDTSNPYEVLPLLKNIDRNMNIIITSIQHIRNKITESYLPIVSTEIDYLKVSELKELDEYSGNISLRIPKSLHCKLAKESKCEGVSLNQYLAYILASRKE